MLTSLHKIRRESSIQLASFTGRTWLESTPSLLNVLIVFLLCVVAFVVRVGYLLYSHQFTAPAQYDGISYDILAKSLATGAGYHLGGAPSTFRPPGYPIFLAVLYSFFGPELWVVRAAQTLLGAAMPGLIYLLALRLHLGVRVGQVAALGTSVHPLLVYMVGIVYPETLSVVLLLVVLIVLGSPSREPSPLHCALAGMILGFLVLVRPATQTLVVLIAFWLLWAFPLRRRSLVLLSLFLLGAVTVIAPWTFRNYLVTGDFVLVSTNGGVNLWGGNNALADGGLVEPSAATWPGSDPPAGLQGWSNLTEKQSNDRFMRAALQWITANPSAFLRLLPLKLERAWWLNFGNESRNLALPTPVSLMYGLFLATAFLGFVKALPQWRQLTTVYLVLIDTMATSLVFFGSTRQSALMVPLVIVLAAFGIQSIGQLCRSVRRQRRMWRMGSGLRVSDDSQAGR